MFYAKRRQSTPIGSPQVTIAMQRKLLVRMMLGMGVGALLARLAGVYTGQQPWSWSSFLASLAGIATGALILSRFWTPPPSPPVYSFPLRTLSMILMLLSLVAFILTTLTRQTSLFFFLLPGLLFVVAAIIGFMAQDRASRATSRWYFIVGISFVTVILLLGVRAQMHIR